MILDDDCWLEVAFMLPTSEPLLNSFGSKHNFELFCFTNNFCVLILWFQVFHVFCLDLMCRVFESTYIFFGIIRDSQNLDCIVINPFLWLIRILCIKSLKGLCSLIEAVWVKRGSCLHSTRGHLCHCSCLFQSKSLFKHLQGLEASRCILTLGYRFLLQGLKVFPLVD